MLLRESRFGMLFKSLIVRVRKRVQQRSGQKVRLRLVITMGLVSWGLIQIKQAECMYEPSPTDEGATPALARLPRALTRREHYQQAGRANILPPLVGVSQPTQNIYLLGYAPSSSTSYSADPGHVKVFHVACGLSRVC
jgi:hypothetical protein